MGSFFYQLKPISEKRLQKKEGDWVNIILYADTNPIEIPEEFLDCLKTDPIAFEIFSSYTDGQKKEFIDWIYSAKTESTKVERIAETLNKLVKQEKLRDNK